MEIMIELATKIVAAILAMWIHEIPKYYLTLYLTKPAYRKDVQVKDIWSKSVDPIGLILLVFLRVGWQMPLKIDASKLINKKNGLIAISLFGMLMNLSVAISALLLDRYWLIGFQSISTYSYLRQFIVIFVFFNIVIMIVNLLPIPPLDMTKVIYAVSPNTYFRILQNGRILQSVFVLFIAFGGMQMLVLPVFRRLYELVWW